MDSKDIVEALRALDTLYEQKESFQTWLTGNTIQRESYDEAKRQLEQALPGLRVVYTNLNYRNGHILAPID